MNTTVGPAPDDLRARMVERIVDAPHLDIAATSRVAEVMRAVPRHLFVPHASVEDAYAAIAVITKRGPDGKPLSCASEPGVVAMMLDQLQVEPGDRVLEIGAGTGYNAALLAELVGPAGQVTTVDIDPEVTAGARRNLDANGYQQVRVITADGVVGDPDGAPYDRIILTVGAWDIAPAWWHQLRHRGRLVLPLRWRGQTRSLALIHHGDRMIADSIRLCGFVPLVGEEGEHTAYLDDGHQVELRWDSDQPIDPAALRGILGRPQTEAWSTVTVRPEESFDGIWLRLTATDPGTCRISATEDAVASGLATPAIRFLTAAIVSGQSLAYLALRRRDGAAELGARGHGPAGQELVDRLCEQVRTWNDDRSAQPGILVYPAGTVELPAGTRVDKPETQLVLTGKH